LKLQTQSLKDLYTMLKFVQFVICYSSCYSQIRFPGDEDGLEIPTPTSILARSGDISPCPRNEKFCETSNDYPHEFDVDSNLLQNSLIKAKILTQKNTRSRNNIQSFDVQTRFGARDDVRACKVSRRQIFPQKAQNIRGEYLHIVNDGRYRQAVEIEQCEAEGEACLTDNDAPIRGNTVCKQKYATYKLYAISADRNQIYDSFSLPSACVCFYKPPSGLRHRNNFSPSRRFSVASNLPRCRAGEKLDLPSFPKRQERNSYRRNDDFEAFVSPQDNIRIPRYDRSRSNYVSSNRYNLRPRWTRSTDECDDLSKYCTEVSNYPDFLTRSLLTKHPALNGNTGNLFKQVFDGQCEDTRKNSIGTRFFTIEDEQLCVGRQKVIFPKKALNLNNEWKFVVNIDNFTQAVEVEECEHSYSSSIEYSSDTFGSCLYAGSSGKNPRLTACKQIYTEYKLLALSSSETNLEVDSFLLPSACACYISGSLNNALELL